MTVPLPPLPPTGEDEHYRPGGRSIADIVDAEHRELCGLVDRLAGGDPRTAPEGGLEVLTAALSRHLSAEEQYLLPAVRAARPEDAGRVERVLRGDRELLTALAGLTPDGLPDVAQRVRRHVTEVGALVRDLREVATGEELIRLGNRLEIAEEAAPTRPHPGTPATPPWNKIVEPAMGVVDKLRDAVAGRPTRMTDLTEPPPG